MHNRELLTSYIAQVHVYLIILHCMLYIVVFLEDYT